jgi:hypothetical protein
LGYSCRLLTDPPPQRVYDHPETGASFMIAYYPDTDFVLDYHLAAARAVTDNFGIAEPKDFDAKLRKTRRPRRAS